jgi:outer membrane protease
LKKNHYISLGLQANQFVNLLTYDNTKKELILQSDSLKRLAFNVTTGQVYIANDTLRITKEIQRQVLQYQQFSNLNVTFGAGKIWSKNRFRYQIGADFGLSILQKQEANYLDENLILQPFSTKRKVQSNIQIYTQIGYQCNRNTHIFTQIAYNQSFTSLDGLAKYNTMFLKLGIGRRF